MATTTLDELIEQTREKANVVRSNFVTDEAILLYLNEAGKQLREEIITADDSYYQATLDFSVGAQPDNEQALPVNFWKMRGLDAFAGDSLRQLEVYAREFRNRFRPGVGYYFGGDGNSIVICGGDAPQANPFRLSYVPKPLPLAALVPGVTRSITHNVADGSTAGAQFSFVNGAFSAADVGGTLTVSGSGTALDGTYVVLTVESATNLTTIPAVTPSLVAGVGTVATLVGADDHTRTFAVASPDNQSSGYWQLANGAFGAGDVGGFIEVAIDAPNASLDGTYTILEVVSGTLIRVTPAVAGVVGPLTGTATVSRQPAGTRHALDLTEDNFSEYYSVRAAMVIARKKRQDSLVAQLGMERKEIEARISALSRMRQSEPQQAPVLRHADRGIDGWEV